MISEILQTVKMREKELECGRENLEIWVSEPVGQELLEEVREITGGNQEEVKNLFGCDIATVCPKAITYVCEGGYVFPGCGYDVVEVFN